MGKNLAYSYSTSDNILANTLKDVSIIDKSILIIVLEGFVNINSIDTVLVLNIFTI